MEVPTKTPRSSREHQLGPLSTKISQKFTLLVLFPVSPDNNSDNNLSGAARCSVKEEAGGDLGGECRMLQQEMDFFFF